MPMEVGAVAQRDGRKARPDLARIDIEIALQRNAQGVPPGLQRLHHGDGTVLVRLEQRQGIDNEQYVHLGTRYVRRATSPRRQD
ncbi:Uncharacterised protein [Bordetella pertussis]|nr:Uncharacterised protein [Bordetella pertussis]